MKQSSSLHLFLVSSPLQLLTATILNLQYLQPLTNVTKVMFIEGEQYTEKDSLKLWDNIVYGRPVRPHIDTLDTNIKYNIQKISQLNLSDYHDVTLYISDLYWTFNNVIYTYLLSSLSSERYKCSIYEEGLVMYVRESLSLRDRAKSWFYFLKFYFKKIPYTILTHRKHENRNEHINTIYCLHPHLFNIIERKNKCKPLNTSFAQPYIESNYPIRDAETKLKKDSSLLFLFQPFTNIITKGTLHAIIKQMVLYFSGKGVSEFYLKAHHFTSSEWLVELQEKYPFKIWQDDINVPIEIYASTLAFENVVAINSSALLNLKAFGYKGNLISFGLDRIEAVKKQTLISKKIRNIYQKSGIEVVNSR